MNLMEMRSQFCKEQGKMLWARGSTYKDSGGKELVGLRNELKALRLEVGELRVNSQTGRHGSGHVGIEGLSQGVGCVSGGMGSPGSRRFVPLGALVRMGTL